MVFFFGVLPWPAQDFRTEQRLMVLNLIKGNCGSCEYELSLRVALFAYNITHSVTGQSLGKGLPE